MMGRYGQDDLCRFMNILSLVFLVLGMVLIQQLTGFAIALMIIGIFRMFSRNVNKRAQENKAYLRIKNKITGWFSKRVRRIKDRKTHRYFDCPSCKKTLRVPKGKGKISITCPQCRTIFEKRS
jgi:hypothetical protein